MDGSIMFKGVGNTAEGRRTHGERVEEEEDGEICPLWHGSQVVNERASCRLQHTVKFRHWRWRQ